MERLSKAERTELEKLLGEAWANIQRAEDLLTARGIASEQLQEQRERLYAEAIRLLRGVRATGAQAAA